MKKDTPLAPKYQDKSQSSGRGKISQQSSLWSQKEARIKKQPTPITLYTKILFGKYAGLYIQNIIHDEAWIGWFSKKTKRAIDPEVLTSIKTFKLLAQ